MDKATLKEIKGIGPVQFRHSKVKNMNISVKPFAPVKVTVPVRISYKKAEEMLYSKIVWIQKHTAKMRQLENEHESIAEKTTAIERSGAKKKLISRLKELADKHDFSFNRVFIRNQKTRWGSCSSKNNINLNIKLVLLPVKLADYVILHELVHTRIRNHDKEFWYAMDKIVSNAKSVNKRLNEFRTLLLHHR